MGDFPFLCKHYRLVIGNCSFSSFFFYCQRLSKLTPFIRLGRGRIYV